MKKILLLTSSIIFTNFAYAQVGLASLGANNSAPMGSTDRDINELVPNYGSEPAQTEPLEKINFAPTTPPAASAPKIEPAPHLATNPNLNLDNPPSLESINSGQFNPNRNLPIQQNNGIGMGSLIIGGSSGTPQRLQVEPLHLSTIQTDISSFNRSTLEEHTALGEKRTAERYLDFLNNPKTKK